MASEGVGAFLHSSPRFSLISVPCYPLPLRCTVDSRRAVRSGRWPEKLNNTPALRCSFQSLSESAAAARNEGREYEISRATLIWRAAKLPIYSVALVPLSVGSAAAYLHTGLFSARRYLLLLFSSFLIIAWLNLSNDVYDYDTGVDQDKKESVVNMIGSRTATQFSAITSIVLGFMGLIWAFAEAGDIRFILLVTSAILCGVLHLDWVTMDLENHCALQHLALLPRQLSISHRIVKIYNGTFSSLLRLNLLTLMVLTCLNFFIIQLRRGVQYLTLNSTVLSASVLVGLTTTFILFCSHFHQIDGDKAVGKLSPLVRLGTETGSKLIRLGVLGLYTLMFAFSICKALPLTCTFLCVITVPIAKLVIDFVEQNHADKDKIFMAKYYCVRLHALFGAALSVGLVFARGGLQPIS